ncbi:MAG: hypothetical protein ACK4TA_13320 [Saprospiraceae bacterium]
MDATLLLIKVTNDSDFTRAWDIYEEIKSKYKKIDILPYNYLMFKATTEDDCKKIFGELISYEAIRSTDHKKKEEKHYFILYYINRAKPNNRVPDLNSAIEMYNHYKNEGGIPNFDIFNTFLMHFTEYSQQTKIVELINSESLALSNKQITDFITRFNDEKHASDFLRNLKNKGSKFSDQVFICLFETYPRESDDDIHSWLLDFNHEFKQKISIPLKEIILYYARDKKSIVDKIAYLNQQLEKVQS